jgi:RimJ/RimL family protein N-acetyltransferase
MPVPRGGIHIQSDRLSIKPFCDSDAEPAFNCITPTLTRFMTWDPPATRADFARIWRGWLPAIEARSDLVFAIRLRDDGAFLGLSALHRAQTETPELGIWIREDRHGKGFGREAVGMIARWATRELGTQRFIYPVAEDNRASRRIAESLGGAVVERRATPKYASVVYLIPRQRDAVPK